ncbi:MAG TPA: HAD-IC family P-type ATPase, partial [Gemmatimonadales bacterium]|nr:HAD-IC family P-type ATPase [Gemmatimonadales bacterium]
MSVPTAAPESEARPHRESVAAVAERLRTDPDHGLTQSEAGRRLGTVGPNRLPEPPRRGPFRLFLAQFADFMVIVLLIAAVVAGMIGEPQDTVVILAIVVLNAVLGFVQAYRAERALAALRGLAAPSARVLRDGHPRMVPADQVVPGDVVLLEEGNLVPADLRLVRSAGLRVDESALTGESVPVEKVLRELDDPDLPVTDRLNLAFRGTTVTFGRAAGIVVATGARTELGLIASLLKEGEQPLTPLQRRLSHFGKWLALAAVSIGGLVVVLGTLRGEPLVTMLLTGVSLAVAAIPEALPAVVTVALALGARQLARQRALVRHLPAVETLGSVTCICADKTGTITRNRMRVHRWWVDGREFEVPPPPAERDGSWPALLRALLLNNNSRPDAEGELTGDPTDVALRRAAEDAGVDPAELTPYPRVAEIPHSAERGVMTTLHGGEARILVVVKGAPEWVLEHAGWTEGGAGLDPEKAQQAAARFAAEGLRVIAVAWRFAPR